MLPTIDGIRARRALHHTEFVFLNRFMEHRKIEKLVNLPIAMRAPSSPRITEYDRAHLATYLSLLFAMGEGKSEAEIAHDILGIDLEQNPVRTRVILYTHLERARWLAKSGYHQLLKQ